MISVAAAAVLMAGFTGCSSDTNNVTEAAEGAVSTSTSTTGGNNSVISNPRVTVTGTVMDTNGNPLNNVTVYVAGMQTTTDAGGVYVFNEVPTINTANNGNLNIGAGNRVGGLNETTNGALQVTIAAPAGYLGATVLVTPESQQISSGDPAVLNGGQTNPNTNFIDGYIASAGTAVLPVLNGTVHGVLENILNGTRPEGVEVCLDLTNLGFAHNFTSTVNVNTSYATDKYCDTTDENGVFDIENAPADAQLAYNLAHWNLAPLQAANVIVEDTVVTNIGELRVVPIVTADTINPVVASVVEGLMPNTNATGRMMLVDDARTEFTLNFSEAINVDSDGSGLPDTDMTDSVNVYVGLAGAMARVNAAAVYNGSQLTITLPAALTDGQLVDVHLVNADFRDMSNNFLALNGTIGYDAATSNVTTAVYLQAFNDLNLNAPSPTGLAQQERDDNGVDESPLLVQASNAFNDVVDGPVNIVQQMNAPDDDDGFLGQDSSERLFALGFAIDPTLIAVGGDVPRVTFTPSAAASYDIDIITNAGVARVFAPANIIGAFGILPAELANKAGGGVVYTPADPTSVTAVEFAVDTLVNAMPGDTVVITPNDDLGYAGTPSTLVLRDNVAPTTALNISYGHPLANLVSGTNTIIKFGNGGHLAQNSGTITPGVPLLAVTAGLLDNLDANGNPITGVLPFVPNGVLDWELAAFDKKFDHDANPATPDQSIFDQGGINIYDSTAFPLMPKSRTLAAAFTEDVHLTGVIPTAVGAATTLDAWTENNDVTINGAGNPVNADLINMDASNVFTLANVDNGVMVDYTGIIDNAANAATAPTNAHVVLVDGMPPMVLDAEFDGVSVIINFNEEVDVDVGDTVGVGAPAITATFAAGDDWVLSNGGTTLTIAAAEFPGLVPAMFVLGSYQEDAYGAADYNHGVMTWTVSDINDNNWLMPTSVGVTNPVFAAVETIGVFAVTSTSTNFNIGDNANVVTQEIVWDFTHPITHRGVVGDPVPANPAFFDYNNAGVATSATGRIVATNAAIGASWSGAGDDYEHTLAGALQGPGAFTAGTTDVGTTEMTLSSDARRVTFSFRTNAAAVIALGDYVTFTGTALSDTSFESEFTGAEVLTISGTAQ